ncbi:MAG: T9SS type A sorting domain-containing protein [Bacteroidota bacterium]
MRNFLLCLAVLGGFTQPINGFAQEFLTFGVKLEAGNSLLNWQMDIDQSDGYFVIERSLEGDYFSPIARVHIKENEHANGMVQYADPVPPVRPTRLKYRVRWVSSEGLNVLSEPAEVSLKDLQELTVSVFPNPIDQVIYYSYTAPEGAKVKVRLENEERKVVYQQEFEANSEQNSRALSAQQLASGTYYLSLIRDTHRVSAAILVP